MSISRMPIGSRALDSPQRVGTKRFSSSVQFRTTTMLRDTDASVSLFLIMRERRPSGDTS
jgi:hypothetical protein